jgi:hypothetical protein
MDYTGLFIYKHAGEFILLDTERSVRIGAFQTECQANRAWHIYITSGRKYEKAGPLTEKDKDIHEGGWRKMKTIPYNSSTPYALYCEDCGWVAGFYPEAVSEGSICTHCSHTLGRSGACYSYETGVWNEDALKEIYGGQ